MSDNITCTVNTHETDVNGSSCECQYFVHLTRDQSEGVIKLLDDEMQRNTNNQDDAYNTYWENIKMALGYAIVK